MYQRLIKNPQRSTFVFGPRGVGKTTWIQNSLSIATRYDLLDMQLYLELTKDPNALYRQLNRRNPGDWIAIDEIQRVPDLLNEVHRLIEKSRLHFVMSGSSARKLRRGGINLLAGRASNKQMFPLVSAELAEEFDLERSMRYGTLPAALHEDFAVDYLRSYAQTYLAQEIIAESLIRNAGNFSRFLEVAARQNAQIVNPNAIARDVGVSRPTVVNHFQILIDTLMGTWLPVWKLKSGNRQQQQSKFYFFDCGVVRAITQRIAFPPIEEELGFLLETLIYNEMRAFIEYSGLFYPIHYWRTYDGAEIDFIVRSDRSFIAIEVKTSTTWQRKFNRGLNRFSSQIEPHESVKRIGVFRGTHEEHWDDIRILPATEFLSKLWLGEIIS